MSRILRLGVAVIAVCLLTFASCTAQTPRNPFDVADVKDPDGDDVKEFAKNAKLTGDKDDKNAAQWVEKETEGKVDSLDGEWSGRWDGGSGRARVKATKERVFILYTDVSEGMDGATWLIEAVRFGKDEIRGRWVNTTNADDTGVLYGRVVDNERIDGIWSEEARWDFRRKLKK